jgi:hypothetical protein
MELITRAEAIQNGHKTYFTGKSCPKGHISPRKVKDCSCVACNSEYAKTVTRPNYYATHSKTILEKAWAKRRGITIGAAFAYMVSVLTQP